MGKLFIESPHFFIKRYARFFYFPILFEASGKVLDIRKSTPGDEGSGISIFALFKASCRHAIYEPKCPINKYKSLIKVIRDCDCTLFISTGVFASFSYVNTSKFISDNCI